MAEAWEAQDGSVPGIWYEEEKRKAEDAISRYPTKVVQPAEIAIVSKNACEEARLLVAESTRLILDEVEGTLAELSSNESDLRAMRPKLEGAIITGELDELLASDSAMASLIKDNRRELEAGTSERMTYALNRLNRLVAQVKKEHNCALQLQLLESLDESAAELKVQLDALSIIEPGPHLNSRIRIAQASVGTASDFVAIKLAQRKLDPC